MEGVKRRKVKDEAAAVETLRSEEDVQRALFQNEITAVAEEARLKGFSEKECRKILVTLTRALQEESEKSVRVTASHLDYAKKLCMEPDTAVFDYIPLDVPLQWMSCLEYRMALADVPLRAILQLPSAIFKEKDYLNHRYTWKKFLYLQQSLEIWKRLSEVVHCQMCFYREDIRSPYICLEWKTSFGSQRFDVMPVLEETVFPYRRFLLEQNNIRGFVGSDGQLRPTPCTNLVILRDISLATNAAFIDKMANSLPATAALLETLTLIKVWCRSHKLDTADGFDDTTWRILVLRGIQKGQVSSDASSLTMFYSVLSMLKSSKLPKVMNASEKRWNFKEGSHKLVPSDKRLNAEAFRQREMEWMADVTGGYDLIWDVSRSWMTHMKHTAKQTLAILTAQYLTRGAERAREIFTELHALPAHFDSVIQVPAKILEKSKSWDMSPSKRFIRRLERVLQEALTDRYVLLRFLSSADTGEDSEQLPSVFICVQFNRETVWRLTDKGPSSEDKEATKAFREFWGKKSELKKFQDGAICEAVTWDGDHGSRHEIIDRQALERYVLQRHLDLQPRGHASQIAPLFSAGYETLATQAMDAAKLSSATKKVADLLRDLQETALKVVSVQEMSPSSRRTECFATPYHPLADKADERTDHAVPRCIEPVALLIHLETSGSWPVHPEAFEKTKTAMYAQLSVVLQKRGLFARASRSFVDLLSFGFAFRLHLMTEKEEKEGSELIKQHQYHSFIKQSIDRHPSLPLTVKLLKRWASAHLLDFHLHDCLLELLAVHESLLASQIIDVGIWDVGFFRVLHLISVFPWSVMALIINSDFELAEKDARAIQAWYAEQRAANPSLYSMALCTAFDRHSSLTKSYPDKAVLSRLRYLAKDSLASCSKPLPLLFSKTDWSTFDVILHLRREALARPKRALVPKEAITMSDAASEESASSIVLSHIPTTVLSKYSQKQLRNQLFVGFDPLRSLWKCLSAAFSDVAVFCCDREGGCRIGVHWKSEAFKAMDGQAAAHLPFRNRVDEFYIPDTTAILSEISILGKGIIEDIEMT